MGWSAAVECREPLVNFWRLMSLSTTVVDVVLMLVGCALSWYPVRRNVPYQYIDNELL